MVGRTLFVNVNHVPGRNVQQCELARLAVLDVANRVVLVAVRRRAVDLAVRDDNQAIVEVLERARVIVSRREEHLSGQRAHLFVIIVDEALRRLGRDVSVDLGDDDKVQAVKRDWCIVGKRESTEERCVRVILDVFGRATVEVVDDCDATNGARDVRIGDAGFRVRLQILHAAPRLRMYDIRFNE